MLGTLDTVPAYKLILSQVKTISTTIMRKYSSWKMALNVVFLKYKDAQYGFLV